MSLLTLSRAEWLKLRGRKVIWTLLAVLVLFSSLIVLIRFGDYQLQKSRDVMEDIKWVESAPDIDNFDFEINCSEFLAGVRPAEVPSPYTGDDIDIDRTEAECRKENRKKDERLAALVGDFTLPGSISKALRWTMLLSVPFVAFFTVMVIGSEYTWGTLRTVLMKGPGRRRLLAAKLALILTLIAVTWLAVLATIIATSAIATAFASGVGQGDWTAAAVGDVITDTARAWYSGLPYVALAAFLSVLFSRWAGGVLAATGVAIGYFFFDMFSVGRLIKLFDGVAAFRWFSSAAEFDLGWNTAAWMFGEGGQPIPGFVLSGAIGSAAYPSDLHAFLVQLGFTAALGGLAFWLFQRRDVTGPSG